MRVRLAMLLALVLIALPMTQLPGAAASAGTGPVVVAQESDESQGGETSN
jgi:hypothetical protein